MHQSMNVPVEPFFQPCDAASEAEKEPNLFDANAFSCCNEVDPLDCLRRSPENIEEFWRIS